MKRKIMSMILATALSVSMVMPVCAEEAIPEESAVFEEGIEEASLDDEIIINEEENELEVAMGMESAVPITANQTVTGKFEEGNEVKWYKLTASNPSCVYYNFKANSSECDMFFAIFDQDGAKLRDDYIGDGKKYSKNLKFDVGQIYYVRITRNWRWGGYSFSYSVNSDEPDSMETATRIDLNQTNRGYIACGEDEDWYQFIAGQGTMNFKITRIDNEDGRVMYYGVFDKDNEKIESGSLYGEDTRKFGSDKLIPGVTYYIKINGDAGHYSFSVSGTAYADTLPFNDISSKAWYYNGIKFVYNAGIMNGTSANTFAPMAPTTREQMVTIVYNMAGKPSTSYRNKFNDVPSGKYFSIPVTWAVNKGITNGVEKNRFGVGQNVTREQVAAFLYSYAKSAGQNVSAQADLGRYGDGAQVSSWARTAMAWANAKGIINGSNGMLNPRGSASRAEIATMIMNYKNNV